MLATKRHQFILKRDGLKVRFVPEKDRLQHLLLRNFACSSFNHYNRIAGTANNDVQTAVGHLGHTRIDDKHVIDEADTHRRNGAGKGNLGAAQSRGRTNQCANVRIVVLVGREDGRNDLRFPPESLRQKWPETPIHEARRESRLLGGSSFTTDEAAGYLACGVELLFVINRQGHEIHSPNGLRCKARRHENDGVSVANENGGIGLLSEAARLHAECAPRERALHESGHITSSIPVCR